MTVEAPLRFRAVVEADLPRIMEIEAAGFLHHGRSGCSAPSSSTPAPTSWRRWRPAVRIAIAILGYVIFWLVHDEVHILNVATAPEARRRGVARR